MSLASEIAAVKESALRELGTITTLNDLRFFKTKYLGRNGVVRNLTAKIPQLSNTEKGGAGRLINELKNLLTQQVLDKEKHLSTGSSTPQDELDLTLPGESKTTGHRHGIYTTMSEICDIFSGLGFEIAYGPEIETGYYNFNALNIPADHPSHDAFDTFYLSSMAPSAKGGRWLLRSHTSPVQIRVMESRQPPFQVIMPGKCFRPDTPSPKHFPMFHQVEGLMVGEDISFAHLKGILDIFCKTFFGPKTQMRFRPSFFPFTEPSAEVDITCHCCSGKGITQNGTVESSCAVCRGEGWLEILGSGMVHPQVLENVGYDSEHWTGFAFGMGVERLTMLKYGVNDIRLFTENHIGFLSQF